MKSSDIILKYDKYTILLFITICLCLLFRVVNITDQSIWLDEAYSIHTAKAGFVGILEKTTSEDFHPPLYYFILYIWINVFGDSEFSCRFLSLIFSVAAVPAMYLIASRLFSKQAGLLSALLLSISVFHIEYAQEVRGYSMLVFFSLLSMYYFIGMIRKKIFPEILAYVVLTLLLLYTHYFGFLVVLCQNIYIDPLYDFTKKYKGFWYTMAYCPSRCGNRLHSLPCCSGKETHSGGFNAIMDYQTHSI